MHKILASFIESFTQIKTHRMRFVLSLVGVFLAVFTMTTATALGKMATQMLVETTEQYSGRATTIQASVYGGDAAATEKFHREIAAKYKANWATVYARGYASWTPPNQGKRINVGFYAVEPNYKTIHRLQVTQGRWLEPGDQTSYVPTAVISNKLAESLNFKLENQIIQLPLLGSSSGPELKPESLLPVRVVGIAKASEELAYFNYGVHTKYPRFEPTVTHKIWVPSEKADEVKTKLEADYRTFSTESSVYSNDSRAVQMVNQLMKYVVRTSGLLALILGSLSVLNIGLVTIRYRIRELGVRRSFGATSQRVFVTIMLESLCATALAAAFGAALSVALVSNIPWQLQHKFSVEDIPPFPVSAAVESFIFATAIGALCGLMPAIIAVRAKVVNAIRN